MAKMAETKLSLCIAEYAGENTGDIHWRRVADYVGPDRTLYTVSRGSKPEAFDISGTYPTHSSVAAISWKNGTNGPEIVSIRKQQPIYEVIEPREFQGIMIEDEAAVRNVLKSGFSIHSSARNALVSCGASLIACIASNTGHRRGIVIRDKSRFQVKQSSNDSFYIICVNDTPSDPTKAIHSIPVVDIEDIGTVDYSYYNGRGATRSFLAENPTYIEPIQTYSVGQYAPLYLKRCLEQAKTTLTLSDDRKLTRQDISLVVDAVRSSLSIGDLGEVLKIDDPDIAERVSAGLRDMLPALEGNILQNDPISAQVRDFLWASDAVRDYCAVSARDEWEKAHAAECEAAKQKLAAIHADVDAAKQELGNIEAARQEFERLSEESAKLRAQAESFDNTLKERAEHYCGELNALLLDTLGTPMMAGPIVTESEALECDGSKSFDVALKMNLRHFFDEASADTIAERIGGAISANHHIAVDGAVAAHVADCICAAGCGKTSPVVTRADVDCSAAAIIKAVNSCAESVVLVEGVYGCADDMTTLAVARRCAGKTVVFSIDDDTQLEKLSGVVSKIVSGVQCADLVKTKYHDWCCVDCVN